MTDPTYKPESTDAVPRHSDNSEVHHPYPPPPTCSDLYSHLSPFPRPHPVLNLSKTNNLLANLQEKDVPDVRIDDVSIPFQCSD